MCGLTGTLYPQVSQLLHTQSGFREGITAIVLGSFQELEQRVNSEQNREEKRREYVLTYQSLFTIARGFGRNAQLFDTLFRLIATPPDAVKTILDYQIGRDNAPLRNELRTPLMYSAVDHRLYPTWQDMMCQAPTPSNGSLYTRGIDGSPGRGLMGMCLLPYSTEEERSSALAQTISCYYFRACIQNSSGVAMEHIDHVMGIIDDHYGEATFRDVCTKWSPEVTADIRKRQREE